jgi:DNA-binding LytR/AlgR family response regulator
MKMSIVEDNNVESKYLQDLISEYCLINNISSEVATFTSAEDFLASWPIELDILFLDIMLDEMNGIEIATKVRQQNERVMIIFTTSNPQFSLSGYAVDALDYLIKPVSKELLFRTLDKAIHRLGDSRHNYFTINNNDGYFVINTMDIHYIEFFNRKLIIYTKSGPVACLRTMQYMEEQLPDTFFRCHNAFLVNLHAVESVKGPDVVVAGNTIPISKHRRKDFIRALTSFVGDKL